jgi:hypothetical protein
MLILNVPIDLPCIVVDITAVLYLDAEKIFPNLEDFVLHH